MSDYVIHKPKAFWCDSEMIMTNPHFTDLCLLLDIFTLQKSLQKLQKIREQSKVIKVILVHNYLYYPMIEYIETGPPERKGTC